MILRSIAAFLLVLIAPVMGAVQKTVLLAQGERAPGYPSQKWTSFVDACVDEDGGVVARAETDGGPCIIYKPLGRPVEIRVRSGQSFISSIYWDVRTIRSVSAGKFVFLAKFSSATSGQSWDGIVYSDATGLKLVARIGTRSLSGTSSTPYASLQQWTRMDPDGRVIFGTSKFDDPLNPYVLRWSATGAIETLLPSAELAPRSAVMDGLISSAGEYYGVIRIGNPDYPNSSQFTPGLVRFTPGAVTVIAKEGDSVPGRLTEKFSFEPELRSCNAAGDILFQWHSRTLSQYTGANGLWLARASGAIEQIAADTFAPIATVNASGDIAYLKEGLQLKRAGQPVETIVAAWDPRPDFRYLRDRLSMDGNGNIVFHASAGIWMYTAGNEMLSIARIGELITYNQSEYRISSLELMDSASGGEDGRPRIINDWGQLAFVARLDPVTSANDDRSPVSVLMMATLPSGGNPALNPIANPDAVIFRSGVGTSIKIDVLANDVNPLSDPVTIKIVSQGAFGTAKVQDGFVHYTPGKLFTGEDSFHYVLSSGWGASKAVTVVVRNPFLNGSGSFGTEVFDGAAQVGMAALTIAKSGRVTGRIQFGTRLLKVNGVFENGTLQQAFTFRDGEIVTLTLRIDSEAEEPARISGSIDSSSGASFEIKPTARFGLPADARPMKVTGQLRADGDLSLPQGIGYLVGSLSSSGRLVAQGRMPDNRAFSASSRMRADGTLAFDCAPYGEGRGRLYGLFTKGYAGPVLHRWDASLRWTKSPPANTQVPVVPEIDGAVTALFATYAPSAVRPAVSNLGPTATGNFTANIAGELPVSESLSWSQRDAVIFTPPNLNRVQLRVSRSTGIVSGTYRNSDQEIRQFAGVIFAPGNGAVGIVTGGQTTGSFILNAN